MPQGKMKGGNPYKKTKSDKSPKIQRKIKKSDRVTSTIGKKIEQIMIQRAHQNNEKFKMMDKKSNSKAAKSNKSIKKSKK
mmetsp:Transcript_32392/g.29198  ORF Transcript_32392/g.29198 Transcript_32392/m.29198 type:complete len:80 (-) Transcript_32392:10-249(-)|eukprot:CAMPEP_0114593798 /NCGR_PEP_ID=MMETSP0125-20121206/15391_1 /TAXON_ID=485358 ORGANISM="Aristerostoma sp., Strain ATCC 50986" /NCGR_SAMPLE_ID=MMETSP0125 /ASSEMBLY_ACC=CAM_ASM_000245 /LENGTH=79 /DNA_ID=CAMNT_0001793335 /DNA_START=1 /DNA_END=240 /DNA_ORIENTATION=+